MNQKDIKFHLTAEEFSVLLATRNMSRFYGLKSVKYQMSDKELFMALHNMYVNQIIQNQNSEGFLIDDGLVELLDEIKRARRELVFQWELDGKAYTLCFMLGDPSVVLSESPEMPNQVSIYGVTFNALVEKMVEIVRETEVQVILINTVDGSTIKSFVLEQGDNQESQIRACCKEAM